jgi:hypothetical protein
MLLCDKLYRRSFDERARDPYPDVLLLRPHCVRQQIERDATRTNFSMKNISKKFVTDAVFGFRTLTEQRQIIEYASSELKRLTRLVEAIANRIAKLGSCQQRLISAAVKGKLASTLQEAE